MQRKQLASINVTPLVDVLLILLVVMMLAMPMFVKRLPVQLPETALSGTPVIAKTLTVSILESGTLLMNDSPTDLAGIQARVRPDVSVEVAVDREVKYDVIARTIAAIQEKSPREISLLTR